MLELKPFLYTCSSMAMIFYIVGAIMAHHEGQTVDYRG